METKLMEAVRQGSVKAVGDLLGEDPLLLDRLAASCFSDSPLHVAAMLGHADVAADLLLRRPRLAAELDAAGSSPLHLAAARGHAAIAAAILAAAPADGGDACGARNQEGLTALHVAAAKGRAEVAAAMVRARPECVRALTDRGETALHVCVARNRLEALRALVEAIGKDSEALNWKDCDGFTVLHIAVAKKQFETIKYLLSTGVDVNAMTTNGSTALDILLHSTRDLRDIEIEDALRAAGALSAKDVPSILHDSKPSIQRRMTRATAPSARVKATSFKKPPAKKKETDWLGRKRSALMIVASLIATVAFQASITPPGGVWQDTIVGTNNATSDSEETSHSVGKSIMASNGGSNYSLFVIFNTLAFLSSLSIILLLVSGLPIKRRRWMWIQMAIMWVSISAQVVTYFVSLRYMSPRSNKVQNTLRKVTEISVLTWLCLMLVVFVGNVIRMNLWVLRKYGYIKQKETSEMPNKEDDDAEEL